MADAVCKPHEAKGLFRLFSTVFLADMAVDKGQLHVLTRSDAGKQIKSLKNKADLLVADLGPFISVKVRDIYTIEKVLSRRGRVETAQDVHQRGFSRTGRPHDGEKFAGFDDEIDVAQGAHFNAPRSIDLRQFAHFDKSHAGCSHSYKGRVIIIVSHETDLDGLEFERKTAIVREVMLPGARGRPEPPPPCLQSFWSLSRELRL